MDRSSFQDRVLLTVVFERMNGRHEEVEEYLYNFVVKRFEIGFDSNFSLCYAMFLSKIFRWESELYVN